MPINVPDFGDNVSDPLDAGGAGLHLGEGVVVRGHVGDDRLNKCILKIKTKLPCSWGAKEKAKRERRKLLS